MIYHWLQWTITFSGFPDNSVGKESTCNAGDPSSIPGSGRSPGEGIGYPLQYSGLENSMDSIVYGVVKSWGTQKRCPFQYRGLECKSRKSRNTWSNRQIWPWSTECSRAKANKSFTKRMHWSQQTPSSNNTREDFTHGHHQMVNTEIRLGSPVPLLFSDYSWGKKGYWLCWLSW